MTGFGEENPEPASLASRAVAEGTPPSMTVVAAVAQARDVDIDDLPALHEALDPDALDAMVREGSEDLLVGFEFAGHEVEVTGDGVVRVLE